MENPLGAQKAIRARELVAVVSPNRKPPLYGQVFQSDAEVERQWSALTSWAAENRRQRFIDGDLFEDRAVLEAGMGANGWERIGPIRFRHIATGAIITDAKPSNVIRGRDGSVWPFDVVVESTGCFG